MREKQTNEDEQSNDSSFSRRRVLSTGATGVAALGMPGLAAANSRFKESDASVFDAENWEVTADSPDSHVDTRVYVGPHKNAQPFHAEGNDEVSAQATTLSQKIRLGTIPDVVPVIGGSDLFIKVSATFGLTEVSADISVCVDDACLSIAGAGFTYSESEVCIDGKGTIKGIPVELEGCLTFNPSLNPVGLEVGGSVTGCLGRNLCDTDWSPSNGWDYGRTCGLCKTFSVSATL
ncbi:hypothetical protein [Halorussus amylolyticus]|uniref:hypothetical protein n=1 Tax=Halorussus amylolyticus TaxID=1126242 RepID=UPI001049638A|nr:hypothetical protein [Halorussus amylolyticus]